MKEINAPKTFLVEGSIVSKELVSASAHEKERFETDFYAVVIKGQKTNEDGIKEPASLHTLRFGVNQEANFGFDKVLFVGNAVSATAEICIGNQTQFVDPSGEVKTHQWDHIKPTMVTETPILELAMSGVPEFACKMIEASRTKHLENLSVAHNIFPSKNVTANSSKEAITASVEKWLARYVKAEGVEKAEIKAVVSERIGFLPTAEQGKYRKQLETAAN